MSRPKIAFDVVDTIALFGPAAAAAFDRREFDKVPVMGADSVRLALSFAEVYICSTTTLDRLHLDHELLVAWLVHHGLRVHPANVHLVLDKEHKAAFYSVRRINLAVDDSEVVVRSCTSLRIPAIYYGQPGCRNPNELLVLLRSLQAPLVAGRSIPMLPALREI